MNTYNAGLGEIVVSAKSGDYLMATGLGSCIALILYDQKLKAGALAHVVLPRNPGNSPGTETPGKFGDMAAQALLKELAKFGATQSSVKAIISGGAQMFNLGGANSNLLNVGERNTAAVKDSLSKLRIPLIAEDTGGNKGRTLKLEISTGIITVKSAGEKEKILTGGK